MSLLESIQSIFEENTNYETARQLVNQAASLKYLSSDLYRDSKRFVYELLQNADDSAINGVKVKVAIKLFGDKLIVAHTGKAFDARDLRGITGVDDGTKKNAIDKTGFKGIGFKAVFGQSNHVVIFSQGEYFRFDAGAQHIWKAKWGESQQFWETQNGRKFEMPWQLIPIVTPIAEIDAPIHAFLQTGDWTVATVITLKRPAETKKGITELATNVNMFLFLKNIELICLVTDQETIVQITENPDNETSISVNNVPMVSWLKHTVTLQVPPELTKQLEGDTDMPEKLRAAEKVDITLAAKLTADGIVALESKERLLYAYLPTEENAYNIPVLVNGAFYTVANRETLHRESPWNAWLFSCIPMELLKWISVLVSARKYDAYNLLPTRLSQADLLTSDYNKQLKIGIQTIPLVVNNTSSLLRVPEALIDFTFLSEKRFVGAAAIRNFMISDKGLTEIHASPFVPNIGYAQKLKKIGVNAFHWSHVPGLLTSIQFATAHSAPDNIALIGYLKVASHNDRLSEVTDEVLKNWPFIFDHKNALKPPKEVFFPTADDIADDDSTISFINGDLQQWLDSNYETKAWLESLGVVEKTDITFLEKTIIPHAASYITTENAIATIQKIFNLYLKGDIGVETIKKLKPLKLLSETGSLLPATQCYFSSPYRPRLVLQPVLNEDIYLSSTYLTEGTTPMQWKPFFLLLGVNEGIDVTCYDKRLHNSRLLAMGVKQQYLGRPEHKHVWTNEYWVDEVHNLVTLTLLAYTETDHSFACIFWNDVVNNTTAAALQQPATVFYGLTGKRSRVTGDEVENYLKWYIANVNCISNSTNIPLNAPRIFINSPENIKIAGKYLPVFEGPELNADWRAFFKFRQRLELNDYLELLTKISQDPTGDNKNRLQVIYEGLLEDYDNWDTAKQEQVKQWAATASLADVNGTYRSAIELRYYADGDHTIFSDNYYFLQLGVTAKRHPNILALLELLRITILRQDQFGIKASDDLKTSPLKTKLQQILPYWAKWMEKERQSGYEEMLYDLQSKLDMLEVNEASELHLTYSDEWSKKTILHYHDNKLHVTVPWDSNKVMYLLPDKLCEIFPVKKYNNEIGFLLKASIPEIKEHFDEQGLERPPIPDELPDEENGGQPHAPAPYDQMSHKQPIDYPHFWGQSKERNKTLLEKCNNDPSLVLKQGLKDQLGSEDVCIYHFSHLENAVSIIREGAIKSRQDAVFQDSAGSGIIDQTDVTRKAFARFYFRPKTPTQHYVENLGRGQDSLNKIGSDPLCPVPVFFVLPLEQAMQHCDWYVSIGSLASAQVPFGNDIETVSKFDFDGVYKTVEDLGGTRFRLAAHQEFLAKDKLDLSALNCSLVVQDEQAKNSLLVMLGDQAAAWADKIFIDASFYQGENPKVAISVTAHSLRSYLSKTHPGYFILQHATGSQWEEVVDGIQCQYNSGGWITTIAGESITLGGALDQIAYKIFYVYKGRIWLIHTNTSNYSFDTSFCRQALTQWFSSAEPDIHGLLTALKAHPELKYYYSLPVGGPDGLSLEQHTLAVISNYQEYFVGTQKLFATEKEYLLCLALHDVGKPSAVVAGDRHLQHGKTLEILGRLREVLSVSDDTLHRMKVLINADPIGKYLNPSSGLSINEAIAEIRAMHHDLALPENDFFRTLIGYYQCDAAGYNSLRNKLFLQVNDKLVISQDHPGLQFIEAYEVKFKFLFEKLKLINEDNRSWEYL